MELLLDGGEEAVEVDVEEAEEVGLGGFGHRGIIFAGCSPGVRKARLGAAFLFGGFG
jgi:hypothetical protein